MKGKEGGAEGIFPAVKGTLYIKKRE